MGYACKLNNSNNKKLIMKYYSCQLFDGTWSYNLLKGDIVVQSCSNNMNYNRLTSGNCTTLARSNNASGYTHSAAVYQSNKDQTATFVLTGSQSLRVIIGYK